MVYVERRLQGVGPKLPLERTELTLHLQSTRTMATSSSAATPGAKVATAASSCMRRLPATVEALLCDHVRRLVGPTARVRATMTTLLRCFCSVPKIS